MCWDEKFIRRSICAGGSPIIHPLPDVASLMSEALAKDISEGGLFISVRFASVASLMSEALAKDISEGGR